MKIAICTAGRFHVADLARELIRNGHEVSFHSYALPRQLENFGVPRQNQICHLPAVAPLVFAQRKLLPTGELSEKLNSITNRILDSKYSRAGRDADVFIGMSGICLQSFRAAKARGSHVILERGSMHVLEQNRILKTMAHAQAKSEPISQETIRRELEGYEVADTISIPSRHVERSFLEHGVSPAKLFRNPYGVDLALFQAGQKAFQSDHQSRSFDVINTGTWCRRKGSDLLAEVVLEQLGLSLLHVGPVGDLPLPVNERFEHHDPVAQSQLPTFYAQAKVFAMPSREDGFGVIYAQALAAGLPIIGSSNSGAVDLAECLNLHPARIQVVPAGARQELKEAVLQALGWWRSGRPGASETLDLSSISWAAYGDRYAQFLETLPIPRRGP